MATQQIEFFEITSEANKVCKSNSRHFLALSALFTYPFVLFLLVFPVLQHLQIIPQFHSNQESISWKHVMFFVLYAFTLLNLYICATATITYSSYHVIFGRPVKFMYAIKSMSRSFIRLLATFFCALSIIFACLVGVGLIVFGLVRGSEYLGFQIEYSSKYFSIVLKVMLGSGLLYLCMNGVLAPVIVVVETSWGLEPLRRSAYLVKGGRGVVVCLIICFGLIMWSPVSVTWDPPSSRGTVMLAILESACLMVYLLYSFTTNTVLYMKCKALHGEPAGKIEEEFGQEYVSLPFHEEVPYFASANQPEV
ncbi:hypothetical protein ACHQM5_006435 [Ranunculus cassubicifolius]